MRDKLNKFRGYTGAVARLEGVEFPEEPTNVILNGRNLTVYWGYEISLTVTDTGKIFINTASLVDAKRLQDILSAFDSHVLDTFKEDVNNDLLDAVKRVKFGVEPTKFAAVEETRNELYAEWDLEDTKIEGFFFFSTTGELLINFRYGFTMDEMNRILMFK